METSSANMAQQYAGSVPSAPFTPGPWRVVERVSGWQIEGPDRGYGGVVCVSGCDREGWTYNSKPETSADARLIAAAPELFEALIGARTYVQRFWDQTGGGATLDPGVQYVKKTLEQIDAALEKALGKRPSTEER